MINLINYIYGDIKKTEDKIQDMRLIIKKIAPLVLLICIVASCSPEQSNESRVASEEVSKDYAYDLDDPRDQMQLFMKLQGDLSGKETYSFSEGRVFGIRPDKPDSLNVFGKEVFRYSGCSMKIMRENDKGNIETKSKGWLLYQDPKTGEFLSEMTNPYTGELVDVPPFRAGIRGSEITPNGPVINANFKMESTAFDVPLNLVFTRLGDRMHITRHAFTKWFESKSETWRTEMTMDTYDFDASYMYDRSHTHIPADFHWTSQTSWLSILKMAGTPGHMIWTSNGQTFSDKADLPDAFVAATKEKQPDVFEEKLSWADE